MAPLRPVEVRVPGDKSITHRALLFSALADGESHISGLLDAADTRSTGGALRALGIPVPATLGQPVTVRGKGLHGFERPDRALDCGNSGTTARLLLGALSGCPLSVVLTGDDSLRHRPMRRVTEPLSAAGAEFDELEEAGRLPLRVRGARPLSSIDHFNERSSAQVKSALILAGLTGGAAVRVEEPGRSRDHTERMLGSMGAGIATERSGDVNVVTLSVTPGLDPLQVRVPGDFSSAAFFLGLGALRGGVVARGVGLNPTRTGMLDVLRRMGAESSVEETGIDAGEPVGDIRIIGRELAGTTVQSGEVPTLLDEIPVLAALAAVARGETRFLGIGELRVKESDRIQAMVDNLSAVGVETEAGPDHLTVQGTDRSLAGNVDSYGDHRIAMAFGVLAALPGNDIVIRGRGDVDISYPGFWEELERVNEELEAQ